VLPTRLPLRRFYEELVQTQGVLSRKHLGFAALRGAVSTIVPLLLRGQTNFVKSLWKFNSVYNPDRQYGDHSRPMTYAMRPPAAPGSPRPRPAELYIHAPTATHTPANGSTPVVSAIAAVSAVRAPAPPPQA
jgi:hypothetical protein